MDGMGGCTAIVLHFVGLHVARRGSLTMSAGSGVGPSLLLGIECEAT